MPRRVLVAGASVAGNTVAWWLACQGWDVTVVEKAPGFRDGGQNVDVRGAGRDVIRRMGLEGAVAGHGTGERGTAWVDEDDGVVARFDVADLGPEGITAELEILRGDLARLLHEQAAEHAAFRFGDSIAAVEQDEAGATVRFAGGRTDRFDVVVVAEGVGSPTRALLFPGENRPRWMDVTLAYFTIPKGPGDGDFARMYNTTAGRGALLRPDRKGTTRALLGLQKPPAGEHEWDAARQKRFLRERFAGVGWAVPRILDGMDAAGDFYFDVLRQVRLPRWSAGRVVLTGDAAWCPTPLTGIGTTLAIAGGYVLAGELSRTTDCGAAFAAYDRVMRPFVVQGQGVPKIVPRLLWPHTRPGVALLRAAMRVAGRPGLRKTFVKLTARNTRAIELPAYGGALNVPAPGAPATG